MSRALMIKKIEQTGSHTFSILWNDRTVKDYRLCDIQKRCPCAGCTDEVTGAQILDPETVREDVRATKLVSVGRYAIRIFFTSGCSNGIYSFDFLYSL